MKKSTLSCAQFLIILSLMVGPASSSFGQSFEGVINYRIPDGQNGNNMDMKYLIKNGNVRLEFDQGRGNSGAMLFYPDQSKMIFILNKMHAFMEMDTDAMSDYGDEGEAKWKGTDMVKTGKMKTIAGHPCEIWTVDSNEGSRLTMCMAKELGSFVAPGNPMQKQGAPSWAQKVMGSGYLPLEVTETKDGNTESKMEATKITDKSLAPNLFQVPEGYKDMSAMMKQMQQK